MVCAPQKKAPKPDPRFDPTRIEKQVAKTIKEYKLFTTKDKVLVACSGGKDSSVALHVLQRLGYTVEAITVNAHIGCYSEQNLENLRALCKQLDVKLHEIPFRKEFDKSLCYIQDILKERGYNFTSCHTCGVLRRYLINKHSRRLKPDVIATGHNLDDEAQAVMMNLLRAHMNIAARTGPRTGLLKHKKFVPRVKPLYFVEEKDIIQYSLYYKFATKYEDCPCSREAYRRDMKRFVAGVERLGPKTKLNIVKSFLRILPKLKEHYMTAEKLKSCELCGEPTNKNICNTCNLLIKIK
jgi:uncharacterized protein (TIGR00269 family)